MAQEATMDPITDDHELAAAVALRLRDARAAGDIEHSRRLATVLRALAEDFVREVDPAGTEAPIVPHLNGQLDPFAVARLLNP